MATERRVATGAAATPTGGCVCATSVPLVVVTVADREAKAAL
ncbi:MAG: hypothetical protein U0P30_01110 [Vicinamibacterales bacterium]